VLTKSDFKSIINFNCLPKPFDINRTAPRDFWAITELASLPSEYLPKDVRVESIFQWQAVKTS